MQQLKGNFILQSLFFKGEINGQYFNNASEHHLSLWKDVVKQLHPKNVMLYSLDRNTPAQGLEKISITELQKIVSELENIGICAKAY